MPVLRTPRASGRLGTDTDNPYRRQCASPPVRCWLARLISAAALGPD
jgi:hypothetical protein